MLKCTVKLQGAVLGADVGQHAGDRFLLAFKLRLVIPQNFPICVKAVGPYAEHKAGGLAVAVPLKADAPVQIEQQAITEVGLKFFFIAASASGPGKIGSVGSHRVPLLY